MVMVGGSGHSCGRSGLMVMINLVFILSQRPYVLMKLYIH